jgi:hypothetical protein
MLSSRAFIPAKSPLHAGEIALECAEAGNYLVELPPVRYRAYAFWDAPHTVLGLRDVPAMVFNPRSCT